MAGPIDRLSIRLRRITINPTAHRIVKPPLAPELLRNRVSSAVRSRSRSRALPNMVLEKLPVFCLLSSRLVADVRKEQDTRITLPIQ